MRPQLRLIRRFECACVCHFVGNKNPRLMNVPARNIIKPSLRHAARIPRHVAGIAAVREQQMIFHFSLRPHAVQPVFQDLFFVVTASVHRRLLLRNFNTVRLRRQEHYHVVCPVETAVKALPLHIIVVSGNQHDNRLRDGSKEIINLFQFPKQRLTLEQISRDQQKVRLFPTGKADDPPEALPDGLPALLAPGKSRIRLHAEMHIRNMNKPHTPHSFLNSFSLLLQYGRQAHQIHIGFHCTRHPYFLISILLFSNYSSQLFTVLGNGMTSRILPIPVRYMTHLSNPSPNPAWWVEPYFLRSR